MHDGQQIGNVSAFVGSRPAAVAAQPGGTHIEMGIEVEVDEPSRGARIVHRDIILETEATIEFQIMAARVGAQIHQVLSHRC